MKKAAIIILIVLAVIILLSMAIFLIIKLVKRKQKNKEANKIVPNTERSNQMDIYKIETITLPLDAKFENNELVEIKDQKVLAKINNLVPELFKSGNSINNTAKSLRESNEILYKVVLPSGQKLTKSASGNGSYRAFSLGKNGIKNHAELYAVNVKNNASIVSNVASSAMGVASMVVGQYYMSQISNQLEGISDTVSKISKFQNNEYKSKVFSLMTQVKTIADFQIEIMENDELRFSKIIQLDNLEKECAQLLEHSNLTINDLTKEISTKFDKYESDTAEIQNWYLYQKSLLNLLYKISELKYVFNLGAASREQCSSLLPIYKNQIDSLTKKLFEWHQASIEKLKINLKENRRKREGIDEIVHFIPGLIKEETKYKNISAETIKRIEYQSSSKENEQSQEKSDLYNEDVQLISKEGKIYYCPTKKE